MLDIPTKLVYIKDEDINELLNVLIVHLQTNYVLIFKFYF